MNNSRPLRTALLANATFSIVCSLFMIFAPTFISNLLGIPVNRALQAIGIGLLFFAIDLIHQATRPRMLTWRALYASTGDFLWVFGTLLGLLLVPGILSGPGTTAVLAVAGAVFVFGAWQLWAINRFHWVPATGLHRHCIMVQVSTHAQPMWDVVSSLGDIKKYMPSLKSSEILDGKSPGVGAIRHCVDHAGKSWSEECIAFENGRRFVVRFHTQAPNFPFPAKTMIGGWEVAPAGETVRVMVWWELQPKPRFLAPIILPILAFQADRDFPKIIERMANDAIRVESRTESNIDPHPSAQLIPTLC